jgi:hypothetical protein
MRDNVGQIARAILLAGGITAAVALPAIAGTPLLPSSADASARIALAAPAFGDNDNNGDRTNDDSQERNIEGSIVQIDQSTNPPQVFVGMVGGGVWARIYDNQLHNSGAAVGDYVKMQGEYAEHGIFDAYHIDVVDNGNGNDND